MRRFLCVAVLLSCVSIGQLESQTIRPAAGTTPAGPADPKAAKTYAKAMKEFEKRWYPMALEDFRKADQQDGGRCTACERQAYLAAKQIEDFKTAHEETALLLEHASSPEEKAEIHFMAGEVCLAEGGNRIFEKPFLQADSEFQAALQLHPERPDCV